MSNGNGFLKPLCVGGVAMALDKYALNEIDMKRTMIFGAVVATGSYVSEIIAPVITPDFPSLNAEMYNGKKVGERVAELATIGSSVFVVNKYVLGNDIYKDEKLQRMGVIVVSDVIGTYLFEYINNQPLSLIE
jgi:hypothetical protein